MKNTLCFSQNRTLKAKNQNSVHQTSQKQYWGTFIWSVIGLTWRHRTLKAKIKNSVPQTSQKKYSGTIIWSVICLTWKCAHFEFKILKNVKKLQVFQSKSDLKSRNSKFCSPNITKIVSRDIHLKCHWSNMKTSTLKIVEFENM